MSIEIINGRNKQNMTVGSKIRQIRKSMKMTQQKFAATLGIVQGFLSAIEKGKKSPSETLLIALQHLYRVDLQWLQSDADELMRGIDFQSTSPADCIISIPLLTDMPTNVSETQSVTKHKGHIALPGTPTGCFAFEYSGDYMQPTIRDGDIIVIKPGATILNGSIGLIVGKWEVPLLRRYREINDEKYFSSDNTAYAPFRPDASTRILGVVVKIWREVRL